jgi:hypothetical protein
MPGPNTGGNENDTASKMTTGIAKAVTSDYIISRLKGALRSQKDKCSKE